jgi:YggT family protein
MFILANFLIAVAQILNIVLWLYFWILIGLVVVSWMQTDPSNPIVRFLHAATAPVLEPVRERMPVSAGGFDFSPVVVWLAVIFLQRFLVSSLYELANALRY